LAEIAQLVPLDWEPSPRGMPQL